MEEMQAQAEHVGAQMMYDHIVDVDLSERPRSRLTGDGGTRYFGDTLVIATWRAGPSGWGWRASICCKARASRACATCDGFFYRGKKVVVIGRRQHGRRGSALISPITAMT